MPSGGGGQGLCRRACWSGDLSSRDEVVAVEEFDVEDVTKDGVEEELRLSTGSLSTIRFIVEDEA